MKNPAVTWQSDGINALARTINLALGSSSESSDDSSNSKHSTTPLLRKSKAKKVDLLKPNSPQLDPEMDGEVAQPVVCREMKQAKTLDLEDDN